MTQETVDEENTAQPGDQDANLTEYTKDIQGTLIFIRKDGLFDRPTGGNRINIEGLTYDPAARTISMDNVNIVGKYDDILSHDKKGAFVFVPEKLSDNVASERVDYKIDLKGHNYLGGYSTFERKNSLQVRQILKIDDYRYDIYSAFNCGSYVGSYSGEKTKFAKPFITFEGDGDLTIYGPAVSLEYSGLTVSWDTALPVWYAANDEGIGIASVNKADIKEIKLIKQHEETITSYNSIGEYLRNIGTYASDFLWCADAFPWTHNQGYYKIGGDKPDVPDKTLEHQWKDLDLGEIGGHKVIVNLWDNYYYDGRKIMPANDPVNSYKYDEKEGKNICIREEDYLYEYELPSATTSERAEFDVHVYVDGKEFGMYSRKMAKHYNSESKEFHSVEVKLKNNRDVPDENAKKPKYPCFSLSFRKESGLDSAFIKEFNSYFKKKENWIRFNILPCDIKYAETTFLGKTGYIKDFSVFSQTGQDKAEKERKKILNGNLKINGNTIKKITLLGPRLTEDKGEKSKNFSKKLKWDKKYNPARPNFKKDFHAEVSGNYIVLTGQGNYTGSVIVNNPLINESRYYRDHYSSGLSSGFVMNLGSVYYYGDPDEEPEKEKEEKSEKEKE